MILQEDCEDYGTRVAEGLGLDVAKVSRLAGMTQEERIAATEPPDPARTRKRQGDPA